MVIKSEYLSVLRIRVGDIALKKTTFLNVVIAFLSNSHYFSLRRAVPDFKLLQI
jgi:hypothetical protein